MRRTLKTMWQNVARKKKKLVDQAVQAARDEVTANVTRAKDDESAALHQQLLETKRALAVEKHAREMLAQDMKRSFMRGVCALNMEAMQVRLVLHQCLECHGVLPKWLVATAAQEHEVTHLWISADWLATAGAGTTILLFFLWGEMPGNNCDCWMRMRSLFTQCTGS